MTLDTHWSLLTASLTSARNSYVQVLLPGAEE